MAASPCARCGGRGGCDPDISFGGFGLDRELELPEAFELLTGLGRTPVAGEPPRQLYGWPSRALGARTAVILIIVNAMHGRPSGGSMRPAGIGSCEPVEHRSPPP